MPALPPHADLMIRSRKWIPRDEPGCVLWLRADAGVTISTGVSAWADQSLKGNNASMATGAKQPTFVASGINGRPALNFDGTKFMSLAISQPAADYALIVALNPAAVTGNLTMLDALTGRLIIGVSLVSASNTVSYYDGAYHAGAATTTGAQVLSWDLRTSPGGRMFKNGTQIGSTGTYTQTAIGGTTGLGVAGDLASSPLNALVAEVVLLKSPTDAGRKRVEQYLGSRIGVAVA